jgi:hypothetical protein
MGSVSKILERCERVLNEIMRSGGREQVGRTHDKPRDSDKECQANTDG